MIVTSGSVCEGQNQTRSTTDSPMFRVRICSLNVQATSRTTAHGRLAPGGDRGTVREYPSKTEGQRGVIDREGAGNKRFNRLTIDCRTNIIALGAVSLDFRIGDDPFLNDFSQKTGDCSEVYPSYIAHRDHRQNTRCYRRGSRTLLRLPTAGVSRVSRHAPMSQYPRLQTKIPLRRRGQRFSSPSLSRVCL